MQLKKRDRVWVEVEKVFGSDFRKSSTSAGGEHKFDGKPKLNLLRRSKKRPLKLPFYTLKLPFPFYSKIIRQTKLLVTAYEQKPNRLGPNLIDSKS